MSAYLTPFRLHCDALGQISGSNGAPVISPTYGSSVTIDWMAGIVHFVAGKATTSATRTITLGGVPTRQSQFLVLMLQDTGGVTYTLDSTYFKSTGTVNPTTGKTIPIMFVSDGTYFRELCRGTAE